MKTLKTLAIAATLVGSATLAMAQGPGINSEGANLPAQNSGPGLTGSQPRAATTTQRTRRHRARPLFNRASQNSNKAHGTVSTGTAKNKQKIQSRSSGY